MEKIAKILITLKSDACVSSGYSYAGIIDSDICYDRYGLPYLPAKRLKGCFRDTAENLLSEYIGAGIITDLFGKAGASKGGSFKIHNALIKDRATIVKEINILKSGPFAECYDMQSVVEQFTHVIAQTAIEVGVASDTSLRYTRVINHISPIDNHEMQFEAEIKYDDVYEQDLENIIKATRHIGLKRNRGLGVVSCKLDKSENSQSEIVGSGEGNVISYQIRNDEPLMLSTMSSTHSASYISGQMVLGMMAGEYLKDSNHSADSEEFISLFLNGDVKYTNAYPCQQDMEYYPSPLYLNKRKRTKNLVNLYQPASLEINNEPGNLPKKLKGKFVSKTGNDIIEVDKKIYYHHRKNNDALLYTSEAVVPEQYFSGKIFVKDSDKCELVESLLKKADIGFGKSKGAEYGACSLISVKRENVTTIELKAGIEYVATLLDDAIFVDETGNSSVNESVIKDAFKSAIGDIAFDNQLDKAIPVLLMETDMISGYQIQWNLHKPLTKLVKAGSSIRFTATGNKSIDEMMFIGEKNQEGYGLVSIKALNDISLQKADKNQCDAIQESVGCINRIAINILEEQLLEHLSETTRDKAFKKLEKLDSSQIGRVTLMLKQKEDFNDFCMRINTIKSESFKKAVMAAFIDGFAKKEIIENKDNKENDNDKNKEQYQFIFDFDAFVVNKCEDMRVKNLYNEMIALGAEETTFIELYDKYVMNVLTQYKYRLKEK